MKNVTGAVTVSGNVNKDNLYEAQIDPGAVGIVMEILSKMYSDGYLAVLREYSCNARDAHTEVGNTAPVRVSLPSALNPSLLIRDYGPGLDRDGLIRTFATYGASTKRDTNDQVGAFGIGSKSAFTIGQQFTVTGVKDGVKTVALFALNESNVATVNILLEQETDEPNGVLVSLAVSDVERMAHTAEKFFSTWQKDSVLVNGAAPEVVWDRGRSVADGVHLIPGESEVAVVMGGVAYPASRAILRSVADRLQEENKPGEVFARSLAQWGGNAVYFTVGIGDVDIAPTREALRDTPKTIAVLGEMLNVAAAQVMATISEAIDAAPTYWDAYSVFQEQKALFTDFPIPFSKITWNGKSLDHDAKVFLPHVWLGTKSYRATREVLKHGAGYDRHSALTVDDNRKSQVLVITGVPAEERSKVTRFAKRFLENRPEYKWLVFSEADAASYDWFSYGAGYGAATMTLEEYREVLKALRASTPRMVNPPSYDQVPGTASKDVESRTPLPEILESGLDVVYWEGSSPWGDDVLFQQAIEDRELVVLLPTQSVEALRKRLPEDIELISGYTEMRRIAKEVYEAGVTDEMREYLRAQATYSRYYQADWDEAEKTYGDHLDDIVNDEFVGHVNAWSAAKKAAEAAKPAGMDLIERAASMVGSEVTFTEPLPEVPEVRKSYPLLPTRFGYYLEKTDKKRQVKHGIAYLNGLALSD